MGRCWHFTASESGGQHRLRTPARFISPLPCHVRLCHVLPCHWHAVVGYVIAIAIATSSGRGYSWARLSPSSSPSRVVSLTAACHGYSGPIAMLVCLGIHYPFIPTVCNTFRVLIDHFCTILLFLSLISLFVLFS